MKIKTNPIKELKVKLSTPIATGSITPKIDSQPSIIEALLGSVYFCPIFCNKSAIAVHIMDKYKTSKIGLVEIFVNELSSKINVTIQDNKAEVINCIIVKTKGSLPFPNFVTETMWDANKNPLKSASPSP